MMPSLSAHELSYHSKTQTQFQNGAQEIEQLGADLPMLGTVLPVFVAARMGGCYAPLPEPGKAIVLPPPRPLLPALHVLFPTLLSAGQACDTNVNNK